MKLNFGVVPFSYAGSYLAFSYPQDKAKGYEKDLVLRILTGFFEDQQNFPIYLLNPLGEKMTGVIAANETELILTCGESYLKICFQNEDTVVFKGNAPVIITKRRLTGSERIMFHDYGMCEIAGVGESLALEMTCGSIQDQSSQQDDEMIMMQVQLKPEQDELEGQITLIGLSYRRPKPCSYKEALGAAQALFEEARRPFQTSLREYQPAMEEAAYINWHTIVKPSGYIKHPSMLMTKNVMNQIWSWDYAINALAMVDKNPKLAYQQFLAMAACQDEEGAYPDCFQAQTIIRSFVKPPIQGFILRKMFAICKPDEETVTLLYQSVVRLTNWWFEYRGRADGIPEYHHGNDSGWDNSTVFMEGFPVKSPDLCSWLVEQTAFLADTARMLGQMEESQKWLQKSDDLLEQMLHYFVVNDSFAAYKEPGHTIIKNDSLLLYIPLILGKRLPETLRQNMLESLLEEGRYVTPYGIASEPVNSSYFVEDGYWRGAIWPPTAFIMTELLMRNGLEAEALKNARSFCDLCAKHGFYENYSAIDGHGQRDCGFTWTASAFMILLRDYLECENAYCDISKEK